MNYLTQLKEYEDKYYFLKDENSLIKIYELFVNKKLFEPVNGTECIYVAIFYERVIKDLENAKKYYLMAIEYNSIYTSELARFYCNIEDYENAKKYYLISLKCNNNNSHIMNSLGIYYDQIKKNYEKSKEYFLSAVERGNICAINNLGLYNITHKNDYNEAKICYLFAIDREYYYAMYNLADLYYIIGDYQEAEKYYLMAIESNICVIDINHNYDNIKNYENVEKYYSIIIKHRDYYALAKFIVRYRFIKFAERLKNNAMFQLANYYHHIKKDSESAEKYYLMTLEHGYNFDGPKSNQAFNILRNEYYKNKTNSTKLLKFYVKYHNFVENKEFINEVQNIWMSTLNSRQSIFLIKILLSHKLNLNDIIPSLRLFIFLLRQKIDLIKSHFEFAIDSPGYLNARKDFDNLKLN